DQNSNRIIVQLPGINNAAEATEDLVRVARLTFRIDGNVVLDGSDLVRAEATYGGTYNAPILQLNLTNEGGKRFETITGQNVNKSMGIYLDEESLMEAVIREKIGGGKPIIDFNGSRPIDELKVYAIQMNSGALPVPLRVIASSTVGPTLGKEAINSSIMAGIIGLLLVFAFMIFFYKVPGALASA
ncbi:MAG TPA: protein translocase subunit SecD, partial [Firmicutes bacterium]|nr:protein translocase subunit SecD [Bacillota bacterium]